MEQAAWILILGLGTVHPMTVSGLPSEKACVALGDKIAVDSKLSITYSCYSYQTKEQVREAGAAKRRK